MSEKQINKLKLDILNSNTEKISIIETLIINLSNKPLEMMNLSDEIMDFLSKKDMEHLIFIFSKNSCNPCIENEIMNIKKFNGFENRLKPILIGINYSTLELKNLAMNLGLKDQEIFVNKIDTTEMYFLEKTVPLYFLLDTHKNARMIFKPNSKIPSISEEYLKTVIDVLCN